MAGNVNSFDNRPTFVWPCAFPMANWSCAHARRDLVHTAIHINFAILTSNHHSFTYPHIDPDCHIHTPIWTCIFDCFLRQIPIHNAHTRKRTFCLYTYLCEEAPNSSLVYFAKCPTFYPTVWRNIDTGCLGGGLAGLNADCMNLRPRINGMKMWKEQCRLEVCITFAS